MSCPQLLRSLQINQSTPPKNKFLIVGRKGQLGITNHQDPNNWACEPIGIYNHVTSGGSKINLIFGTFL